MLLISGIPGIGKSYFAQWCAEHHGFLHVDLENGGLEAAGLAKAWSAVAHLPPSSVRPFVSALRALNRPMILDWGYPPAFLPLIQALHEAGVVAWWLDGDHDAARQRFTKRGTVSIEAFEVQMSAIRACWRELSAFYASRVVTAIKADGTFSDPNEIYELILGDRSSPDLNDEPAAR
jgi:hypothetical protein